MTIAETPTTDSVEQFAQEIRAGLSDTGQKTIPSKYLYNPLGSTLFEAVSLLPEYGLTRAEERILRQYSREIVRRVPNPAMVSELGSGSGRKTRWILSALCEREPLSYYPIEISHAALASCESELRDIEHISIVGVEREYLDGLREVASLRPRGTHLLVLFLGSTIGNFDAGADARFLRQVRSFLLPGDSLLLGADLMKPVDKMLKAYDDPLGITAAFNLNLLARINQELCADFDLLQFEHMATFNELTRSIEMHIRSKRQQVVSFQPNEAATGYTVSFQRGETIWTESCHKYTHESIRELAGLSGFRQEAQWTDDEWPFAETLLLAG
jgi:dimethylhistidine N-methyltransferase